MIFECPVCCHKATSYETLFRHVMTHKKADITTALLKRMEQIESEITRLESEIAEIKESMKEAKINAEEK